MFVPNAADAVFFQRQFHIYGPEWNRVILIFCCNFRKVTAYVLRCPEVLKVWGIIQGKKMKKFNIKAENTLTEITMMAGWHQCMNW